MTESVNKENSKFVNLPPDIAKIIVAQRDSWQGFSDEASVQLWKPTESQKQIMLRYPAIRAGIRMTYLPMLAARPVITGDDEKQKTLLDQFFRRSYHRIARQLLWRGIGAGYAMGEKLYGPITIDGKVQWMVNSAIIPPPQDCRFTYAEDMTIKGFIYSNAEILLEKTLYYIYQGDEIAQPKGVSICEDVFFGWKMLMEDWSRYSIWKDLKAVPAVKMYYPEKETLGSSSVEDPNAALALEKAKEMRNLAVVTLPKALNSVSGEYVITWDVEEMKNEERNPGFIEAINKDESLIFMGALVPKRIIEQDMKTGALAMVEAQKDFFFEVVRSKMHEFEEYLRKTVTEPLLMKNFGSVGASFDLDFGDEKMAWYLDVIKQAVTSGAVGLDWEEIMTRFNIPHMIGKAEPEIKVERKQFKGIEFAATQKDIKEKLDNKAVKWAARFNRALDPIKEKFYTRVRKDLEEQRGVIGLRLHNLFKSGPPSIEDLVVAVQTPSRIFENSWQFIILAWEAGQEQWMEAVDAFKMKEPSKDAENELYSLDLGWEGFYKGRNEIAGEGEELERRLFFALRNCQTRDEALREFTLAFDKYAEEIMPDRMSFLLHQATLVGFRDAQRELQRRRLEKQAGK